MYLDLQNDSSWSLWEICSYSNEAVGWFVFFLKKHTVIRKKFSYTQHIPYKNLHLYMEENTYKWAPWWASVLLQYDSLKHSWNNTSSHELL